MSQLIGKTVLVRYGTGLWHERYILAAVEPPEFVVVSPDYDVFVEQLDLSNEDISGLRFPPQPGAILQGIGDTYSFFPQPTDEELVTLTEEGAGLTAAERAARGVALRPELPEDVVPASGHGVPQVVTVAASSTSGPRAFAPIGAGLGHVGGPSLSPAGESVAAGVRGDVALVAPVRRLDPQKLGSSTSRPRG